MTERWPFKVHSTETTHDSRRVQVHVDDVSHEEWWRSKWERVMLNDWVSVLPIDKQRNVYLIETFAYWIWKTILKVVAWVHDKDKSWEEIAYQELIQEAWITSNNIIALWANTSLPLRVEHTELLYLATDLEFGSQDLWEFERDIKVVKMPLEEAVQKIHNNEIQEPNSKTLIYEAWIRKLEAKE